MPADNKSLTIPRISSLSKSTSLVEDGDLPVSESEARPIEDWEGTLINDGTEIKLNQKGSYPDEAKQLHRNPKLPILKHQSRELIDWFVNEDLMLYGKSAYKSIPKDVINRLAKKAKEYGGNPLQMFNFLKSRRKYYTNMKSTIGKSGRYHYSF